MKQALPEAQDTGMKKEERFGVEGSDVQSPGRAGPGLGLVAGCDPALLHMVLSLGHFGRGMTALG